MQAFSETKKSTPTAQKWPRDSGARASLLTVAPKRCTRDFDEIRSTSFESWCREGELNPQDPKVGGF